MHSEIKSSAIIGIMVAVLLSSLTTAAAYASGPRGDYPDDGDATQEEDDCWANGYDSGFIGKFDKGRNDECQDVNEEGENYYIFAWAVGCEDGPHDGTNRAITGRSVLDCIQIMNNPVEIDDY